MVRPLAELEEEDDEDDGGGDDEDGQQTGQQRVQGGAGADTRLLGVYKEPQ